MKNELLVARTMTARGIRRAVAALSLGAALCATLAGAAPAQAANLLANPSFDFVGPLGPSTSFTGLGAAPSAANMWRVYHKLPGTTRTELVPNPWGGRMIHVYTTSHRNGLLQAWAPFNQGPMLVKGAARLMVVKGKVAIGTGNGPNVLIDATSTMNGVWETISAPNGTSPANTMMIYAVSLGGAEFYVDIASVSP
jgi:hypothetical protein